MGAFVRVRPSRRDFRDHRVDLRVYQVTARHGLSVRLHPIGAASDVGDRVLHPSRLIPVRGGNIGDDPREIEFEPLDPITEPAPAPVPSTPQPEPVPA